MVHADTAVDAPLSSEGTGPGQLLRRARESRGIALHDIAAQLHLDVRTVQALERDAFDVLPAPTFVRGYLRGYARLLNVPSAPVMEAYDREGFRPPDLVADISERPQAASGDLPVRLLTYAIVIVLAALVIWWWYDRELGRAPTTAPVASAPGLPSGTGTLTLPTPNSGVTDAPAQPSANTPGAPAMAQQGQPADTKADSKTQSDIVSVGTETSDAASTTATQDEATASTQQRVERVLARVEQTLAKANASSDANASSSESTTPQTSPSSPTTSDSAVSPATLTPPATESSGANNASIRLHFPVEAWVEIYDRDNKRLFFNLVKPGRTLDLMGKPPVRMVLGRSNGVTLRYNGEDVDLAPYIRKGGVAQLTLGE